MVRTALLRFKSLPFPLNKSHRTLRLKIANRTLCLLQAHFSSIFSILTNRTTFYPIVQANLGIIFLISLLSQLICIYTHSSVTCILNASTSFHTVQILPSFSWTVITASACLCFYYSLFYSLFTQQPRWSFKNENLIILSNDLHKIIQ